MYFPKRDELSFRTVLALPNAAESKNKIENFHLRNAMILYVYRDLPSKMGFASKICCSIQECLPLIAAKYCKISFVLSVLPAPLSPLRHKHSWI